VDWATPKISAHTSSMMFCRRYPGNDQRLPQGQFARTPLLFIPWFFEEFADYLLQFIELR